MNDPLVDAIIAAARALVAKHEPQTHKQCLGCDLWFALRKYDQSQPARKES
jgi:hypothetical protein